MAGVCYSVRMYEDTSFNLLGSSEAPEGKTWLLNFNSGLQGWLQLFRGWDQGDELPAHGWWALVSFCVTSELRKEVFWILLEFSQNPNTISVASPKLVMHGIPWQHWGKCQGQQWATKVHFLLAWSDVQGVLTLTGGLDVGHCGGFSGPHARSPCSSALLHGHLLPKAVWIMPSVGLWNEGQGYGHSLASPWTY